MLLIDKHKACYCVYFWCVGGDKAPSDAIAGFLVRPGGFFRGIIETRKTALERVLSGSVIRYVRGLPQ